MADLTRLNRELARLDGNLRSGRLDVKGFRAERRKLLLDYDERNSTTTPGAARGSEITRVDPPFELPAVAPSDPPGAPPASTPMGMRVVTLVAGLIVIGLGSWWFLGRPPATNVALPAAAPVAAPAESAVAPASADLPQDVANALIQSSWSEADVNEFLERWNRLAPEAVRAATDDPRIWLLRGQTEQRLRDAREAESLDTSELAKARRAQLEQIQAAIR